VRAAPAAYVFDLYGTLVDIASLRGAVERATGKDAAFLDAWRAKQIAYSFCATLMERYADFDALTAAALDYVAAQFGVALDAGARGGLIDAWGALPAYPEVAGTLSALRARGCKLGVLTNASPRSLERTLAAAGLRDALDAALSVDAVRAFKPSPRVYALATERFGLAAERIAFVSSNGWDATGAAEFGMGVIWCNRAGLPAETFGARPARTIGGLAELLAAGA
jgi:2-haloacid dehalogenase